MILPPGFNTVTPYFFVCDAPAYITSILCCIWHWRQRQAAWFLGAIGALCTGGLVALFLYGREKDPYSVTNVLLIIAVTSGVSLIPGLATVRYFRRRFVERRRGSKKAVRVGVALVLTGAMGLVAGVVMWLRAPQGNIDYDLSTATAMTRAVGWFLSGAILSAIGLYVGLREQPPELTCEAIPRTPPNDGPATRVGNVGVTEGPPPVS